MEMEKILKLNGFGDEKMLRIEEVAVEIGSSIFSINLWYRFKKQNPDNKYAKLLPDFYQPTGSRQTRYWRKSDIPRLLDFKTTIPHGCGGVMGSLTNRKGKTVSDGQN